MDNQEEVLSKETETENVEKEELTKTDAESGQVEDETLNENGNLQKRLEESDKKAEEYYDQLLRLKADFENYRRRSEKEKRDFLEWGKEKILLKQISINDVLEQALKSAKSGGGAESILIGLEMLGKEFFKMLSEEGIEEIKCEKFDPQFCEALDFAEVEGAEDGEILEVYQKGYKMNGRLIRVAKVKIVKNTK